nr:MAG TPA: protein of unknown function (DUF2760) [Caudoviricetes sp.]
MYICALFRIFGACSILNTLQRQTRFLDYARK